MSIFRFRELHVCLFANTEIIWKVVLASVFWNYMYYVNQKKIVQELQMFLDLDKITEP